MSIPSVILVEEIKQKGFSKVPFENVFGEICIGYGHRILSNPDLLNSYDRDLAHAIKLYDGNGFYDLKDGVITDYQKKLQQKLLDCGFRIDEEKAQELLIHDISNNFEELTQKSSAFRHLINSCGGDGYLLANTQMSVYYNKLKTANQNIFEENSPMNEHFDGQLFEKLAEQLTEEFDERLEKNSGGHSDIYLGEHFKRAPAYNKDAKNVHFAVPTSSQKSDFILQNSLGAELSSSSGAFINEKNMESVNNTNSVINSSGSAKSISIINSVSNSSSEICQDNPYKGEYRASRLAYEEQNALTRNNLDGVLQKNAHQKLEKAVKSKKSKKKNLAFFTLPHSEFESALVRLDTVMYLAHIIGVQKVLEMKAVLACIRMDDFMSAAGYMLSNSWGENFGKIAVILSRRMRYGLMVSRVDEEVPEHLKQDYEDERLVEKETEKDDEYFGFYDQMPKESHDIVEVAHS